MSSLNNPDGSPAPTNPPTPTTPPATPLNFNVFTSTNVSVTQSNWKNDNDTLTNPLVENLGQVHQVTNAYGMNATAGNGIVNGIGDGSLQMVGGDMMMAGLASASSVAIASALAGTQTLKTGGNVQQNAVGVDIVGGHDSLSSNGGNDASSLKIGTLNISNPAGTSSTVHISQTNTLSDHDKIHNPKVQNTFTDSGSPNFALDQDVYAKGGTAFSGVGNYSDVASVAEVYTVGDDMSVSGTSSADASASASAKAFTQDIETGGNQQFNIAEMSIVGLNRNGELVSGDDAGADYFGTTVTSDIGGTTSTLSLKQSNSIASDHDIVENARVENHFNTTSTSGFSSQQHVRADGGTATADDGIHTTAGSVADAVSIADDMDIDGSSSAAADAAAVAQAFTQSIATGGNQQFNVAAMSVVGVNKNSEAVGEDKADQSQAIQDNNINTGGTKTYAGNANDRLSQSNGLDDRDNITAAKVIYSAAHGKDATVNDFYQEVVSYGGTANAGDGIQNTNINGYIWNGGTVGDDAAISGSSSASAKANSSAEAFTQTIVSGGNVQLNQMSFDVVGASQNLSDVGQDGVPRSASFGDAGNGVVDTRTFVSQTNTANDTDNVTNPEVLNLIVADLDQHQVPIQAISQNVQAYGGGATAQNGIQSTGNLSTGSVGDDYSVAGSANANASANASAEMFTQSIATGGNAQFNLYSASIVGGNETAAQVGEDRSGQANGGVASPVFTDPETAYSEVRLNQSNTLTDHDVVSQAKVYNASNSAVTQTVTAKGGTASTQDGIDAYSLHYSTGGTNVGDDYSAIGSASADASASAVARAFTQDIATGGNVMVNSAEISVVGANRTVSGTGHDDAAQGNIHNGSLYIPVSPDNGSTLNATINQSNGYSWQWANDHDRITNPTVENAQYTGNQQPNDPDVRQTVWAEGGNAQTADGIDVAVLTNGNLVIGDDGLIDGSASSAANAAGMAEAFTQDIDSGRNVQQNQFAAAAVGANQNTLSVAEDDLAGGHDLIMGGYNLGAKTNLTAYQENHLNDDDWIESPLVSNRGDVGQTVTAKGGTAGNADANGIEGAAGNVYVGDDLEIDGSSIASADAVAMAKAFTQAISTGGNIQVNSGSASVVGINDTYSEVGHDDPHPASDILPNDSLAPIILPDPASPGSPVPGTQTTFDFDQVNALSDQDSVLNARVENTLSGDLEQIVNATGGNATTGDGIEGGWNGLLANYGAGDNFLMNGVASASADAQAVAEAFTQNIVTGANIQVNALNVSVVGGSSTVSVIGADDLV